MPINDTTPQDAQARIEEIESMLECRSKSIDLLSRREHAPAELKNKLRVRQFKEQIIRDTLEWLTEQDYLSAERYKEMRMKSLIHQGYGNHYIVQDLSRNQIQILSEEIENLRSELGQDPKKSVDGQVEKWLRVKNLEWGQLQLPEGRDQQNRLIAAMGRRGHPRQATLQALDRLKNRQF